MYRINPENEARIMDGYAKAAKIKRKPVVSGLGMGKRGFPAPSSHWTTKTYTEAYEALNGSVSLTQVYADLSDRVSVPQGEDSMEVEQ
tara:strand:- start:22 stop:285 length:264 start_codon:yes stop_codon:yes gene_type:complete